MGERVVRNDEVRGSIPLGSTSELLMMAYEQHLAVLPVLTTSMVAARGFSQGAILGSS